MNPEFLNLIAVFAGAASGAAGAVWAMFTRELTRMNQDIKTCKDALSDDIREAKKTANQAHARLDVHLQNHH